MREIKFRCFYRGAMYPVKELFFGDDAPVSVSCIEMTLDGEVRSVSPDSEHVKGLTQYTGLKDKNGKEIYEGDILKFFDKPIAVVEWMEFGGWAYRWIDEVYKRVRQRNPEPFFHNINLWEVIGNIYQDKHLLE